MANAAPRGIIRVIPPAVHFVQDCLFAGVFLLGPVFLPLGDTMSIVSPLGGIILAAYNALTDRPGSLWPVLGEAHHRVLDAIGVIALLVVPRFFEGLDRSFFSVLGATALVLHVVTDFTPDPRPARPFAPRLSRWSLTTAVSLAVVAVALRLVAASL